MKNKLKAFADGIIWGLLMFVLISYSVSSYAVANISTAVLLAVLFSVISAVSFFFLIVFKQKNKILMYVLEDFGISVFMILLIFLNYMSFHITLFTPAELTDAYGFIIVFIQMLFINLSLLLKAVILLSRYLLILNKK